MLYHSSYEIKKGMSFPALFRINKKRLLLRTAFSIFTKKFILSFYSAFSLFYNLSGYIGRSLSKV